MLFVCVFWEYNSSIVVVLKFLSFNTAVKFVQNAFVQPER